MASFCSGFPKFHIEFHIDALLRVNTQRDSDGEQEHNPLQAMTTPKLLAVQPWNFNREWRGEDKPIQHTAQRCQLYRETEKNSIRLFYSHTTYFTCGIVTAPMFVFWQQ